MQNCLHLYSASIELSHNRKLTAKLSTASTKEDISSARINENTLVSVHGLLFFIFNEPVIRACKHYVWYSCWSYCKYKGHLVLLRQFTAVVESVVWVNVETVNIPICRSSSIRPEVMGAMNGCLSSDVALLNTSHVFSRV